MRIFSKLLVASICLNSVSLYAATMPPLNTYLSAEEFAITHINSAQTDAFNYSIPTGTFTIDLNSTAQVSGGPICIMTLRSTSPDYVWSVSSGGVAYINMADNKWEEVARLYYQNTPAFSADFNKKALGKAFKKEQEVIKTVKNVYKLNGLDRIRNGVYSLVDNENVLYANIGKTVYAFGLQDKNDPSKGIKILRSYNMDNISKKDSITGLSITYDGKLIIVSNRTLAVIDREFINDVQKIEFGASEFISNSIAVDRNNAIYIASDKRMYKIIWNGLKLSMDEADGAWSSDYETHAQPPVIKMGTRSGSTPTLMGFEEGKDQLVVITDGANQMNLVAFWRNEIPKDFVQQPATKSRRIAGQIKVTCGFTQLPKFIQSEQSVVVKDYGAFVVNNIGIKGNKDLLVGVMGLGPIYPPPHGIERFEWDSSAHKWTSVWSDPEAVSTSMLPSVSIPSNMVLVNGFTKEDGWEVTGFDWDSGQIVHRTIFGHTNFGNGAYALLEVYPDNNLIFNSIAGPYRIEYRDI